MSLTFVRTLSKISKFKLGDDVIIEHFSRRRKYQWLIEELKKGEKFTCSLGTVLHDDIISTPFGSRIPLSEKASVTVKKPTMSEYIRTATRDVQTIYGLDCSVIATLLDLHIEYPELSPNQKLLDEPVRILEAGTGSGSLTLTLAKLLHPANAYSKLFEDKALRGGILYTIDNVESRTRNAMKKLKHFRSGMYFENVEFVTSDSPTFWLQSQQNCTLDACVLDLPDVQLYVNNIMPYLNHYAPMIVFAPSVTQIVEVVGQLDRKQAKVEAVYELSQGVGAGLRKWNVASLDAQSKVVCRPDPPPGVVSGGFIALLRRYAYEEPAE